MKPIDVLIVGAGPGGLACAIRLADRCKRTGVDLTVVVIDKAPKLGYHNLSGAVFEPACLDELIPGWRENKTLGTPLFIQVSQDEPYFLTKNDAIKLPHMLVPKTLRHENDLIVSVSQLVRWLGTIAKSAGIELYMGFAARELLTNGTVVQGVKLVDQGKSINNPDQQTYLPGEEVRSKITVIADGSRGVISRELTLLLRPPQNPQIYSIGLKQLIKLASGKTFGQGRVIHTIGYPLPQDVFGGGFIYGISQHEIAIGLIIGLDWPYPNLDPQQQLEAFKEHPFVRQWTEGGQVIGSGVKTIPEGGYYSLPQLVTNGAILVGDAAGFVDLRKTKGLHYAIYSGICAADTIIEAFQKGETSEQVLSSYYQKLEPYVLKPMWQARNFRQVFKRGLISGAILSRIQHLLPVALKVAPDYATIKPDRRLQLPPVRGTDKAAFVSLSGTTHREDEPSHILIKDPDICRKCIEQYGAPCVHLCPGEVYKIHEGQIILSPSNCMHDGSCHVKCPFQNIVWTPPEGGEGPRYKRM